jgi:hypothetical protein
MRPPKLSAKSLDESCIEDSGTRSKPDAWAKVAESIQTKAVMMMGFDGNRIRARIPEKCPGMEPADSVR